MVSTKKRKKNTAFLEEKRRDAPKWYLILSVIISLFAIIIAFTINFSLGNVSPLWYVWYFILVIWLVLNIVMVVRFVSKRYEKLAILLSAIHLFDYIFSFIFGIVVGIIVVVKNISDEIAINSAWFRIGSSIFQFITLFIAVKLLVRKK